RPAPGVLEAIADAQAVIVCPSNPITSIGPILAVPGVVEALASTAAKTVAISPIVGRDAVSGPAGRLMAACGLPASAAGGGGARVRALARCAALRRARPGSGRRSVGARGVAGHCADHHGQPRRRGCARSRDARAAGMSLVVAVPVKDLVNAKQRLIPMLSAE